MTKSKQYLQLMLDKNKKLFDEFKPIHDQYALEPEKYQDEFNRVGADVVDVVQDYENRLCSHSEKGKYGQFSHKTADTFRNHVRKLYPKIDDVGIEVTYQKTQIDQDLDDLKKLI